MSRWLPRLGAGGFACFVAAAPVVAQVDYRNLDRGRPGRIADAAPVERYAFELTFPYSASFARGSDRHVGGPHLEYGIARNVSVGVGAELGSGVDEVSLGLFASPWRETRSLPAIGFSLEVEHPFRNGDLAATVGLVTTRSFGRSRLHGNFDLGVVGADPGDRRWTAAFGWDYTLFRTSTLFIAEVAAERREDIDGLGWTAAVGIRRQIAPTWVLHAGLGRTFTGPMRATEVQLGLSYVFGIAGLMRRAGR